MPGSLLDKLKEDVAKSGTSKGKIFFVSAGSKARIRFLQDLQGQNQGRTLIMHERWEPLLKVPCAKNYDEDAPCKYCEQEGIKTREWYCFDIWDYDNREVKIFAYPVNRCTPMPALAAVGENFGTLRGRDFVITRGIKKGMETNYTVTGLDKSEFKEPKAKPFSDKEFLEIIREAFPDDPGFVTQQGAAVGSDDDWGDEPAKNYDSMKPQELFALCKERYLNVEVKKPAAYYKKILEDNDAARNANNDFWGDDSDLSF